ncbi:MAG TPA: DUF1800 domain-containing protein [Bacteroidia bacterium]|jgi:uncharacterized protein (DUF1800 family)|nr:DUF1800 domain-containing protein [Bacteroidia bacterium]
MDLKNLYHLYSRAGFGISIRDAQKLQVKNKNEIVDLLLSIEGKQAYLDCIQLDEMPSGEQMKSLSKEEKKDLGKEARNKIQYLNTTWIKQLVTSPAPLLEKTTLFWHGHFACRIENPYTIQQLNNIQRQFAFSPFKDLLLAVSKSPAMLQFLNNRQNHKQQPNENFARELMELFTIGRDNYTEQDIKESARAFTGWNFKADTYEFVFREKDHDDGVKAFMQQTGNFNGEDIINIILTQKQTSVYLCKKFYRFFVNETIDDKRVAELADYYYQNNYDTGKLLKKIFTADWFYDDINVGVNIKSPVEFIVGLSKSFSIIPPDDVLLKFQRALGQVLFYPPNVAGWPGGRNWIDSSTLLLRLKAPSLILNGGKVDIVEKDDMPEESFNLPEIIKINPDEKSFYADVKPDELIENMLMPKLNAKKKNILSGNAGTNKQLVLKIVSMPEYQLC